MTTTPGSEIPPQAGAPHFPVTPAAAPQAAAGGVPPAVPPAATPADEQVTAPLQDSVPLQAPFAPLGTAATQEYPAATQEYPAATQEYPAAAESTAYAAPVGEGAAYAAPVGESAHPKTRGGALVAGIAIGALLGGLVGGGTAALVGANMPQQTVASSSGQPGTITLNNLDEVSTVSAVAAVAMPSVVTIQVTGAQASGSGSGVIYSADGYIVTNRHVATLDGAVGSEAEIRVRLSDGRVLDGTVVGTDPFSDLAVVKVEADDLTPIALSDSDKLNVGDLSVAIGAPLNLANTVTSGIISALNRGIVVGATNLPDDDSPSDEDSGDSDSGNGFPWDFRFGDPGDGSTQQPTQSATASVTLPVVQTDASINPGNSGGALLNANGELIGINVAIASNGATAETAGSDGLGFAIPVNLVVRVADAIIAGDQPSHGLLGVSVGDSSQDTDEDANRAGGLIMEVTRGGAADQGGLRAGDVVTAVNGVPVDSGTTLSAMIRMHEGGSRVTIDYTREGVAGKTTVTLGTLEW